MIAARNIGVSVLAIIAAAASIYWFWVPTFELIWTYSPHRCF